ncbi:hypothetical protein [Thermoflexus sp.]|uniref:hypothetical protein n=1 Tax=Thermoflexus sp. TaxID=1969742 RepID=UPI0035E3F7BC
MKPAVGYRIGRPDRLGPGPEIPHDRTPSPQEKRLQSTIYEIAAEITNRLQERREERSARHVLFPQMRHILILKKRVRFTEKVPWKRWPCPGTVSTR